ncbi:MAG: hypothetical protein ACK5TR_04860 [Alphaproteobacteria bacterium]|jgi:hypothetical protein|nr:hypothetical protein [Alphaproteobacteria bacterium]
MIKHSLLLLSCLSALMCSGCVGSALVHGDDAPQGDYPDLHSVPDRPAFTPDAESTATEVELEQGYEADLAKNEALRAQITHKPAPVF